MCGCSRRGMLKKCMLRSSKRMLQPCRGGSLALGLYRSSSRGRRASATGGPAGAGAEVETFFRDQVRDYVNELCLRESDLDG